MPCSEICHTSNAILWNMPYFLCHTLEYAILPMPCSEICHTSNAILWNMPYFLCHTLMKYAILPMPYSEICHTSYVILWNMPYFLCHTLKYAILPMLYITLKIVHNLSLEISIYKTPSALTFPEFLWPPRLTVVKHCQRIESPSINCSQYTLSIITSHIIFGPGALLSLVNYARWLAHDSWERGSQAKWRNYRKGVLVNKWTIASLSVGHMYSWVSLLSQSSLISRSVALTHFFLLIADLTGGVTMPTRMQLFMW